MAASNAVTRTKEQGNGMLLEEGTWTSSGGTTTLTFTAGTNADGQKISRIEKFGFSSNGDTGVFPAQDVAVDAIKITFTANDAGKYWIEGPAA